MGEIFCHESPRPDMENTGERLTVGHFVETELEHYHRYYLARTLVAGKDVLEVASGEGYGAAILSQAARSVRGVDVSVTAVAHAQLSYKNANLTFVHGSATAIPADDASVDVVTSFETLEHFNDHEAFFREVKRILRPGGLLILSTPNRDVYSPPDAGTNPYHVHELTKLEFQRACAGHFAHVALFAQFTIVGSAILADAPASQPPVALFERRGDDRVEYSPDTYREKFCLAFASDAPLPAVPSSLSLVTSSLESWRAAEREVVELRTAVAERDLVIADRVRAHLHEAASLRTSLQSARAETARVRYALEQLHARAERFVTDLAATHGPVQGGVRARIERLRNRRDIAASIAAVQGSALFQADWYCAQYPDVVASGLDPATHYARLGAFEGRNPGPDFDSAAYFFANPDVLVSGHNPLRHYEQFGRAEGRAAFSPAPFRFVSNMSAFDLAPAAREETPQPPPVYTVADVAARQLPASDTAPRIVYISGESRTPGHAYRVARHAEAARFNGARTLVLNIDDIPAFFDDIANCDLLVVWRAAFIPAIRDAVTAAKSGGAIVQFDVDDLMFEPEMARAEIIDGIRSLNFNETETANLFGSIAEMVMKADICSAPTHFLAKRLQRFAKPSFVLPNGYDENVWRLARAAVRARALGEDDGLIRIGYPAGSKTHQKDFSVAADALGQIMRDRPDVRLVLFHSNGFQLVGVDEFPQFAGLAGRIEWREMVPIDHLPAEMARLDIAIAPLELGNPFCEAKSELKFFEAALVGVPLIASPTDPFARAIQPGKTGFLARSPAEWEAALRHLIDNPGLRRAIGRAAYHSVLWPYGPDARTDRIRSLINQRLGTPPEAARAFELDLSRRAPKRALPDIRPHVAEIIRDNLGGAEVTVILPLYNYENFVLEALDSVAAQTLAAIDLVVVDDCSTDDSYQVARDWMLAHKSRFNRLVLIRNDVNSGLGFSRNIGFANAETPFVLPLDADNRLLPDFAEKAVATIRHTGAAFVFPIIQLFGDRDDKMGDEPYDPAKLACGNYIDAMALVRLSAWAEAGGYDHVQYGWEDYDLWCRFAERGFFGIHLAETLAMYRVHGSSMLRTQTDIDGNKRRLIENMRERHPWAAQASDE